MRTGRIGPGRNAAGPAASTSLPRRDAGGSRTHLEPLCRRSPRRLAPASDLVRGEWLVIRINALRLTTHHSPLTTHSSPSVLARSRTWPSTFAGSRAESATPRGRKRLRAERRARRARKRTSNQDLGSGPPLSARCPLPSKHPAEESNLVLHVRSVPCVRHTRRAGPGDRDQKSEVRQRTARLAASS